MSPIGPSVLGGSLVITGLLLFATAVAAQLQLASIAATVVDYRDDPVPDAIVTLKDSLGAELQRSNADSAGRTMFGAVPPGRYLLQTHAAGAAPFDVPVNVSGALPIVITLRVPRTVTDIVMVQGQVPDEPSSRGTLAGDSLRRVPSRVRGRALQDAVSTLPGWSTEDNGLLHSRGVDDGFLYVIDGVPIYERIDALSGLAPDLASASAINVLTGYVPPEFGHKAGGVIEIRSASGEGRWSAAADLAAGSHRTLDGSLAAGGTVGAKARVRGGMTAVRSDRFLDPVDPANFHNTAGQASAFGQLDWPLNSRDRVTAGWNHGRSHFDVPNTSEQQAAGQHQRQRLRQSFLNGTWQRTISSVAVTQMAVYHRRTNVRLEPGGADTPLVAEANRHLIRTGALFAVARQQGTHLLKVGTEWQRLSLEEFFTFAITDPDAAREADFRDAALRFTPANPFVFIGSREPTLWSAYFQDAWHIASRVTLSGGIRFDHSALLLTRSQWSPRVGAAIRVATDTVARASLSRFFQPPQPENLLLSSSPEAHVLSSTAAERDAGGADLEPERQWAMEFGVEQRMGRRITLNVAYWRRQIENAADPNVFAGTTIIFPNAVAEGRAHGIDARLELPRHRGWSGYVNWSAARVVQTGPITGGLFLDDEVDELGPGVEFAPDHDQRFTAGAGVTWEHTRSGVAVSAIGRHETGTPVQQDEDDLDQLMMRPGAELVDFDSGRVRPRTLVSLLATLPVVTTDDAKVVAGVQLLNVFDERYAYNFGNPFSGTHFGAPRTVSFTLRVTFPPD